MHNTTAPAAGLALYLISCRELHCKTIEEFLEFTKACSALHYCRV